MSSADIKRRAIELSQQTDIDTIPPTEVGGIMLETVEYIEDVELNGSSLGIRKTYATVAAMEADTNPRDDFDNTPLRRGMLVSIYNQEDPEAADNGSIYSYQKPGWQFRSKVDAGYATYVYLAQELAKKQSILVSGSNIKTLNDESLVGSGNLEVQNLIDKRLPSLATYGRKKGAFERVVTYEEFLEFKTFITGILLDTGKIAEVEANQLIYSHTVFKKDSIVD